MKENANLRKWCALFAAIIAYFVIHEGCHALVALSFGSFERIRLLGLGVQVIADLELMSNGQIAFFSLAGCVGTLLTAYLLVGAAQSVVKFSSKMLKAIGYYTTLTMLLVDPLYLTVIYKFVGGGDMNGVKLLGLPELILQIIFGIIALLNLIIFFKRVYPCYKKAFAR